jgi:hypothetical protein
MVLKELRELPEARDLLQSVYITALSTFGLNHLTTQTIRANRESLAWQTVADASDG